MPKTIPKAIPKAIPGTIIHPTAIVDPKAELGAGVQIGPYTIIGPEVKIGDSSNVMHHVTLDGKTELGKENWIGPYTSIGLSAQDRNHRNEDTLVVVGDRNEIREGVTINRGTLNGTGVTKIGNDNQIMINSHIGHDCSIGDFCMLANEALLGGHCQLGSYIVTGAVACFHQFSRIGDYAMIGALSGVVMDVVPFAMVVGQRAKLVGVNQISLKRNGFSREEQKEIKAIFQLFFRSGLSKEEGLLKVRETYPQSKVAHLFTKFIRESTRGLVRY